MKYMLDTNIIIYLMKNHSEALIQRFHQVSPEEVCVSSITYAELEYGVSKSDSKEKNAMALLTMMSKIRVLPFDSSSCKTYGEIRSALEKSGKVIGANDMLIAAHAKSLGLTLVTNNTREFDRISGLNVEDWTK